MQPIKHNVCGCTQTRNQISPRNFRYLHFSFKFPTFNRRKEKIRTNELWRKTFQLFLLESRRLQKILSLKIENWKIAILSSHDNSFSFTVSCNIVFKKRNISTLGKNIIEKLRNEKPRFLRRFSTITINNNFYFFHNITSKISTLRLGKFSWQNIIENWKAAILSSFFDDQQPITQFLFRNITSCLKREKFLKFWEKFYINDFKKKNQRRDCFAEQRICCRRRNNF